MSPLPSPAPLRRSILKVMFSPLGLFCGFVLIIMATCPGARGDEAFSMLLANGGLQSTKQPADLDQFQPVVTRPVAGVADRPILRERAPISAARSKTPAERARESARGPVGGASESVQHTPSALPLFADPIAAGGERGSSASLVPMTGPAVGVRRQLPRSGR